VEQPALVRKQSFLFSAFLTHVPNLGQGALLNAVEIAPGADAIDLSTSLHGHDSSAGRPQKAPPDRVGS